MRAKFMTSAATFAGILAFTVLAGQAQAQAFNGPPQHNDDNGGIEDSYNDRSGNEIKDSFNDNRRNESEIEDSFNDNSRYELEVDVDDSFNDNRRYESETKVEDSFNDNRRYESETKVEDSFNDNREYEDSFNTDNSIDDSFNDARRYDDSFNTDNSQTNLDLRLSLNVQELSASVSDIRLDMDEDSRGDQNGRIRTGAITQNGGAFAGFAGIQTVTNNTGLASIGQAATAVSANANVTFGSGGE